MRSPLRTWLPALLLVTLLVPAELTAQSSMFGVRGLGLPGRPFSARVRGTGGSFAYFDGESDANPAAITTLPALTAGFVASPGWREWQTPAGSASLQETRFPLMFAAGPVPGSRLAVAISVGSYADRDYRLASKDTVDYRGSPITVRDTIESLGGMNQLRLATAFRASERTSFGAAVYWLTGSNRMKAKRVFADSAYVLLRQSAEMSYGGFGLSLGVVHRPSRQLELAGTIRMDSKASVSRDSTHVYDMDLPWTAAAGLLWHPSPRMTLGLNGTFRTWGSANADVQAQGGIGTQDSWEGALGMEYATNRRRPTQLPIRLGLRYGALPFLLHPGESPREFGASLGSGTRFARERAGVDFAVEYASRKEAQGFDEHTFQLILGLSISPYGPGAR